MISRIREVNRSRGERTQVKRFFIFRSISPIVLRLAFSFALAGILLNCGGDGEKTQERRDITPLEKVSASDKVGGVLDAGLLDSLRARKERYRITRDEYWNGRGGVLANEFFEVWYPPGRATVDHGMYTFGLLVDAKKKLHRLVGRQPSDRLTVICSPTMESYTQFTGFEWWMYSRITGDEIHFQPIDVLYQRHLVVVAVRRGYFEWGIPKLSGDRAPRWFTQGLSSLLSEEEYFLESQLQEFEGEKIKMDVGQIESALEKRNDRKEYRIAAYNAFRMVRRVVAAHGREKVAEVIRLMGEGDDAKTAFEKAYGQRYKDLVEYATDFQVNR